MVSDLLGLPILLYLIDAAAAPAAATAATATGFCLSLPLAAGSRAPCDRAMCFSRAAAAAATAGGGGEMRGPSSLSNTQDSIPAAVAAAAPAAAAAAAGSAGVLLPAELGERYIIEKELGRGVYGTVYLCRLRGPSGDQASSSPLWGPPPGAPEEEEGVRVAIKAVRLPCNRLKKVFGLDQQVVRELVALRSLSHANIVALKAFHFSMEPWNQQQQQQEQQQQQQQQKQQQQERKKRKKLRPTFYFITELCHGDLAEALAQKQRRHKRYLIHYQQQQQQQEQQQQQQQQQGLKQQQEAAPLPGFSEEDARLIVYQVYNPKP